MNGRGRNERDDSPPASALCARTATKFCFHLSRYSHISHIFSLAAQRTIVSRGLQSVASFHQPAMGCGASASKKDGSGGGKKSTTGFASASLIVDNQGKIQQFYDIDKKKIGEGSYGSVCKARNKATKAMRAIKTINKAALKSPEAFKKEIQIMKILDHPNICKLYESFQDHRYI